MRIVFAGTPVFAVPSLQALIDGHQTVCGVYTQPDRPAGRGQKLTASPVKQLAEQAGIAVYQPENFKDPEAINTLAALKPDLMVVVAYGLILPQAVLDIPQLGCINVHGSLLPRWRGAAPIHRALMAGDSQTGITIMKLVRKLDAGDMLHKIEYPIGAQDTSSDLHDILARLGAEGLMQVIEHYAQGKTVGEPQDEALVTYAHKLEKQEAIIDWQQSTSALDRQIRGLNPWPVAQTYFRGQALKIWHAEPLQLAGSAEAGMIRVTDQRLEVATGDGWLRLLEVQLPGGKRIQATDFLNAHACAGERLGS